MSQIYLGTESTPSVATSYVTDVSGPVSPIANVLTVVGGNGISTDGSVAGQITINLTEVASNYVNVTNAMSPYDVASDDYFVSCDTSTGVITVRLPDSPTQYDQFVIKDRTGDAITNNVTVTTVGGVVLIDGSTTQTFEDPYESLELIFNGTSYESF